MTNQQKPTITLFAPKEPGGYSEVRLEWEAGPNGRSTAGWFFKDIYQAVHEANCQQRYWGVPGMETVKHDQAHI